MGISRCKTSTTYCMYHFAENLPNRPFIHYTSAVTVVSIYFRPRKILGVNTRDDHTHTDLYVKYVHLLYISLDHQPLFQYICMYIWNITNIASPKAKESDKSYQPRSRILYSIHAMWEWFQPINDDVTQLSYFLIKLVTQAKTIHRT